ncbi:MAG TPA: pyridoxal-phosphate dependent enzyme [Thermoflexia bacterium]|nr:pyridoxal-phosphate dependent enzyme [Thermoflexia bacterium]
MRLACARCGATYRWEATRFRCDCGGPLKIADAPAFNPARVGVDDFTLWRYRHTLPLPRGARPVTLGEGMTPLVEAEWDGLSVHFKCESLNPTGSFKDRGTAILITALAATEVEAVVEDSSGNAGSSLAAYAARAGLRATIYVPAHASPAKKAQIAAYGARLVAVPGPRAAAAEAVLKAADRGAVYASHVYHPLIHHGMKTIAFELWEQLGRRAPDAVVLPVGHGSLLLGLAMGFDELRAAGCTRKVPRLYGIQAAACAPLVAAWERGAEEPEPVAEGDTVAEGVRIAAPVRGREILTTVRASGGGMLAVSEPEIRAAWKRLAHRGFYVEPTSAVAVAALDHLQERLTGTVVAILTGSGLKHSG